jgi:hypothetical protein
VANNVLRYEARFCSGLYRFPDAHRLSRLRYVVNAQELYALRHGGQCRRERTGHAVLRIVDVAELTDDRLALGAEEDGNSKAVIEAHGR